MVLSTIQAPVGGPEPLCDGAVQAGRGYGTWLPGVENVAMSLTGETYTQLQIPEQGSQGTPGLLERAARG